MFSDSIIVVPWDFSEHSNCALDFALKRFAPENIRVICVLERPNPYSPGDNWGDDAEKSARSKCQQRFFEAVGKTRFPGLQFFAEFGDPATETVRFARKVNAEMIVISTHGLSGIKRLVLGSVAHKISLVSECPVLLLPNNWFKAATHGEDDSGKASSVADGD